MPVIVTVTVTADVNAISEEAPGEIAKAVGKMASNMFGGKPVDVEASVKVTKGAEVLATTEAEPPTTPPQPVNDKSKSNAKTVKAEKAKVKTTEKTGAEGDKIADLQRHEPIVGVPVDGVSGGPGGDEHVFHNPSAQDAQDEFAKNAAADKAKVADDEADRKRDAKREADRG